MLSLLLELPGQQDFRKKRRRRNHSHRSRQRSLQRRQVSGRESPCSLFLFPLSEMEHDRSGTDKKQESGYHSLSLSGRRERAGRNHRRESRRSSSTVFKAWTDERKVCFSWNTWYKEERKETIQNRCFYYLRCDLCRHPLPSSFPHGSSNVGRTWKTDYHHRILRYGCFSSSYLDCSFHPLFEKQADKGVKQLQSIYRNDNIDLGSLLAENRVWNSLVDPKNWISWRKHIRQKDMKVFWYLEEDGSKKWADQAFLYGWNL